jgi:hypothetical protein
MIRDIIVYFPGALESVWATKKWTSTLHLYSITHAYINKMGVKKQNSSLREQLVYRIKNPCKPKN